MEDEKNQQQPQIPHDPCEENCGCCIGWQWAPFAECIICPDNPDHI